MSKSKWVMVLVAVVFTGCAGARVDTERNNRAIMDGELAYYKKENLSLMRQNRELRRDLAAYRRIFSNAAKASTEK